MYVHMITLSVLILASEYGWYNTLLYAAGWLVRSLVYYVQIITNLTHELLCNISSVTLDVTQDITLTHFEVRVSVCTI